MAAWYVFGVLGMYPLCPGKPEYVTGTPFANRATVCLGNGRTLTFASNDGDLWPESITHKQLLQGGVYRTGR